MSWEAATGPFADAYSGSEFIRAALAFLFCFFLFPPGVARPMGAESTPFEEGRAVGIDGCAMVRVAYLAGYDASATRKIEGLPSVTISV